MNQEIKLKMEQAADALFEHKGYSFTPCDYVMRKGFLKGAQTILENPEEWGLRPIDKQETWGVTITQLATKVSEQHSQLTKYREALGKAIDVVYSLSEPIQELIDILEGAYYEGE